MKMVGKIILFLLVLCLMVTINSQTLLLEENFDYGIITTDLVTASLSVWTNHSGGTGASDVQYLTSGLTYSGYIASGIGGSADISNFRTGDDSRAFISQSSGNVYLSTLVNVSSATSSSSGEYILHFGNTSTHYARLYVKNSSSNLRFGISKSIEGATFSSTNFSFGQTYLVVVKYTFLIGTQDDRVDLWVFSNGVPSTEITAGTPTIENVTAATTDASSLSVVSFRQGTNSHSVTIDGIRISDSWSEAPLPVELSSFSASIVDNGVRLSWRTETELNNYGFYVERSSFSFGKNWTKLGFVKGNGNSNSPKEYSFMDENVASGKYAYRLKQIDNNGTFTYSKLIEIDVNCPLDYELSQNYPNPFNLVSSIKFNIPEVSMVTLKVFNTLGEEITVLINEVVDSGTHEVSFNAIDLNNGIYFYRIEVDDFVQVKKMTLLK